MTDSLHLRAATRPVAYRPIARWLHWLTALLVLTTIPVGVAMVQKGLDRGLQDSLFIYHKNVGPLILLLVILRLVVRLLYPPPPLPETIPHLQRRIAEVSHWLLYLLLVVMAVSGYVFVKAGGFPLEVWDRFVPSLLAKDTALSKTAEAVHLWTRFLLFALIALHIGAALFHLVVKRDGVFARMWPGAGR